MTRVLAVLLLTASPALAGDLHTLTGKTFTGDIASLSDKEVVFRTPAGTETIPTAEVLLIGMQRDAALPAGTKYSEVELIDGSILRCAKFSFRGKEAELRLAAADQVLHIPLAAISYILNDAQDQATRQDWQEKQLPRRGNQDILAVKVEGVINGIEGTLSDSATPEGKIPFEYGPSENKRKRDIDLANAQGVIFQRTLGADALPPLCKVHDVHQNVLVAAKLTLGEKTLTIDTVSGAHVEYPLAAVARLDYSNDKIVFLSDLKPAEQIEKSRQGRVEVLRLDKNLENGPLQLEGQIYAKGLALHAFTDLTYNLDGKYAKFEAVLGMDDQVPGDGKPAVKIEGDGKELFASTVTRKDKRQNLSCDVKGIRQLRIMVSPSGLFDFGDHVDLANAKLSK
jgi:hypothetical protein